MADAASQVVTGTCYQLLTRLRHLLANACGKRFSPPTFEEKYAMYAEKHSFQNRYTRWLQIFSTALALWQLTAFLGAETGLPWLPLGHTTHLLLLIFALAFLLLLASAGLSLRVSSKGWALRLSPFQLYHRFVAWEEIKNVRLMKPGELPSGWNARGAQQSFGHTFLISNPAYDVVCLELVNGFQVFVSIQHRSEMIEFLHNGLLKHELKKKLLA